MMEISSEMIEVLNLYSAKYSRKEYLDFVANLIQRIVECQSVAIRVYGVNGDIPCEAYVGYDLFFWESEKYFSISDICACAPVVTGEVEPQDIVAMTANGSVVLNDSVKYVDSLTDEERSRFRAVCMKCNYRSIAITPIKVDEKRIGLIHVADKRPEKFNSKTIMFLEKIADIIGQAIHSCSKETELKKNFDIVAVLDCVFNSINDYVYVSDPYTYEIIYANPALKELYKKNLVGGICYSEFHGLDKPCDFCTNDKILEDRDKPYKWEHYNNLLNKDFFIIDKIMRWPDGRDVRFEMALDITKSKKAEKAIARRLAFVETVKRISSRFIGTIPFDHAINESLKDIGTLCSAHRAYLFCISNDQKVMSNTHEWCAEGVTPQIENLQNLPTKLFPWWMSKLKLGEVILINDINELPEDASAEKEILQAQDIKSVLILPVFMTNQLAGFIGFDNVKGTASWSEDDLAHLRVAAEIIGNVMARDKAQQDLTKYKILAERTRDIILFVRMDGKIIEANDSAVQAYGYSRKELLNKSIYDIRKKDEKEFVATQMRHSYTKGLFFETVHYRKDGSCFPVEVSSQGAVIGNERMVVSIIRDISERKQAEQHLQYLATHDHLTSVPNRYYLEDALKGVIAKSTAENPGALLFVDIDNFKVINDTFGHAEGDKVLISVVNKIKQIVRKGDFVARLGGDKFAIITSDTNLDNAQAIAERLLKEIQNEEIIIQGTTTSLSLTVSIGIAVIDGSVNPQSVFSCADVALYGAKEGGKNRIVIIKTGDEKTRLLKAHSIVVMIKEALRLNNLFLYFQPVYKLDGSVIYYEALVRLFDHGGTIVSPGTFLPIAEKFGLVSLIDRWVVQTAINILKENPQIRIFVNISASSLGDEELLKKILASIKESGIEAGRIGFEITETTAIKDLSRAERWIRKLKEVGCKFALDDFGVGFSSFTRLHLLPVDFLKIDGSFIKNLDSDQTKRALVNAMNAVAHTLGKATIAECVENEQILSILKDLNVDCGQGYFLGMPSPLETIVKSKSELRGS